MPRLCGIATFTHDLCEAVSSAAPATECYTGAVNDRAEGYKYPPRVRFELQEKDLDSYRRAADYLNFNNADVLCVQHEFGIYGGPAGSHLLALLKEVRMPVVTTLHTILSSPNPAQRKVMNELVQRSDRLVVMARKGAEILRETYAVPEAKIDIIPHGIPDIPFMDSSLSKAQFGVEGRKVLLTFGLLGPGKGIEYAIEALPEIVRQHPNVVYLILGATHPHLIAKEGERYRLSLERLAEERGVKEHVIFYNRFVSPEDLTEFIGATDIYLTPYLNEAQITSGTLAYVFGAGKAVVSTPYWHAQELLADDRGSLVPFHDSGAIAGGVCAYFNDPARLEKTRVKAYEMGREMIWPAVAKRYIESFQHARADRKTVPRTAFAGWTLGSRPYALPPLRLDHIIHMSDGTGIFQHAIYNVPDFHHGYCTDDTARAFILCNLLDELGAESVHEKLEGMATTYLAFLASALNRDTGRFRNFMSHSRVWLEEAGSEDSHGRALWALGIGAARSRSEGRRRLSAYLFQHGLAAVDAFTSPRTWAFTLLGLHEYLREFPLDTLALSLRAELTARLVMLWKAYSTDDWPWFENSATYDNARLSQALILSGQNIPDAEALDIGLKSLGWLASIQKTQAGHFRPIGSNGFYVKDGARADFDQQPVEAQAMVSACLEAFRATQDAIWAREAKRAFEWFLGRNDLGLPLYDSGNGGCYDGLHSDRVNENQGAESSLAFHLSLAEMSHAESLNALSYTPRP
ncbi:glycosyltransferase involved in cell wall biosynthesis [Prosthecobacter fusiformis]|uniref:Glycosyltransferase involved in cell wall biosynthesis n=1 Tax=Prosthecobacter fusiformis TaxID=48464 RepID=A0A4R7RJK5_9BACT|nr:glycosyltransferase family 4 protein [Prosthecobacter fusiformis]TDU63076.1 glycosyltransferase involved in cell wall biosynthesis [Prosthecobacter fusiformis]